MILKASQRGGARQLARHLLKTEENEHVEIHEISGFMSDNIHDALQEIYAVSQGTKCRQFMFSVSLNPPQTENVPVEYFENALAKIEKETGLEGQPRAIVFHEKEGRRHAHCVWSRINTQEMKAVSLSFYKLKLREISKELYYKYGWQMPRGMMDSKKRDPLNFSLSEWQQAKRLNEDPQALIELFRECWAVSDSKNAFAQALKERGFTLAKGDRRGFVAVDYRGEIFSLSRKLDIKPKELKSCLGDPKDLPSVAEVKVDLVRRMTGKLENYVQEVKNQTQKEKEPLLRRKQVIRNHHRKQRQNLKERQEERWKKEETERFQRLPRGFKGIWYRITGKYKKIRAENERETENCQLRDRDEKQNLINRQLQERQRLQKSLNEFKERYQNQMLELRETIAHYVEIGGTPPPPKEKALTQAFEKGHGQELY